MVELVYIEKNPFGKVFYYDPKSQKGVAIKEEGNPFVMPMSSDYNPLKRDPDAIFFGVEKDVLNKFFDAGRNGDKKGIEKIIREKFPEDVRLKEKIKKD
ncbi:hypothetical protein GW931_01770 [archaeon]|nr:hypothetical protein [archaeon]